MNDRPFAEALRLRLRHYDEANRRATAECRYRRYFRHDTWYSCVIVAPSRPGDIAIVTEAWAIITVAEQMAEFATRANSLSCANWRFKRCPLGIDASYRLGSAPGINAALEAS